MSYSDLTYRDVLRKHIHNSYERKESLFDQALHHMVRSFELDIRRNSKHSRDWWVAHDSATDEDTTAPLLSEALARISALRAVIPGHEVITIWIEFKDDSVFKGDEHTPAIFDDLLCDAAGGVDGLITPTTIADNNNAWPSLQRAQGKLLFVVLSTGSGSVALDAYKGCGTIAFIRDQATGANGVEFVNKTADDWAPSEKQVNRITKANDFSAWIDGIKSGTEMVGTDKVDETADTWSSTHNRLGWPFLVRGRRESAYTEGGATMAVEARSGDIWNAADSCVFVSQDLGCVDADLELSAYVSVPTRGDPWAKACIMARADERPDSPYFAVCRPLGADHRARLQYRLKRGGSTNSLDVPTEFIDVGYLKNLHAYFQLRLTDRRKTAQGLAGLPSACPNPDALECPLEPLTFDEPLNLVGVAASSHDPTNSLRFVFGAVTLKAGQQPREWTSLTTKTTLIGEDADGGAQDGVLIGCALQRVASHGKSQGAETIRTSLAADGRAFLVQFWSGSGKLVIDEVFEDTCYNAFALEEVVRASWHTTERALAGLYLHDAAYLANYSYDSGTLSLDRFTTAGSAQGKLTHLWKCSNWATGEQTLAAAPLGESSVLVRFGCKSGAVAVSRFEGPVDQPELTTIWTSQWDAVERSLAWLRVDDTLYLANYRSNGTLSIDRLDPASLALVNLCKFEWTSDDKGSIVSLHLGGAEYLACYRSKKKFLDVYRFTIDGGQVTLRRIYSAPWSVGPASGLGALALDGVTVLAGSTSGSTTLDRFVDYTR